jgi:hypothetical protein
LLSVHKRSQASHAQAVKIKLCLNKEPFVP